MFRKAAQSFAIVFALLAGVRSACGFALLGPFAPWMTAQLSYQDGGYSIGGPMNIGEGYRWNIPVITYGFDQSFLDYFGSNGVAAVQSAIQILNDLPPASAKGFTNYPYSALLANDTVYEEGLWDLKSHTLSLLLEQLGLAQPTRFTYCLSNYSGSTNYTVIMRNFDPVDYTPSPYVNGQILDYWVESNYFPPASVDAIEYFADSAAEASGSTASVADDAVLYDNFDIYRGFMQPSYGQYFTSLTMEDVAGLSYLLSTNNLALESLIPGVTGAGANASNFVNTAVRPGVDKITFQQLDYDPIAAQFIAVTNQYTDTFLTNNVIQQQTLQRVITRPDILFTVQNLETQYHDYPFIYTRTGTCNWVNNGAPSQDGPGVIQPPVVITFDNLGPNLVHYGGTDYTDPDYFGEPGWGNWASFDGTTNAPVLYAIPQVPNSTTFRFTLTPANFFSWNLNGEPDALFLLQTSTDLLNWTTITTITNLGGTFTYWDESQGNSPIRYFRTIPE